ncbi:MAG: OsmC family protein, partial [Gemmatimonadota bacterium]|nr:OsmC family protein [Gemmatimonadota bacterium]
MSTLTASLTTGTQVKIATETHEWLADEPLTKGGTDIGPNPYDLLLGSLAACTCITMSLYAQHKGIELDSVTVSFEFDRVQAEDCEECDEDDKGLMERIRSDIKIKGSFD